MWKLHLGMSWSSKPYPEDRINKKPKDQKINKNDQMTKQPSDRNSKKKHKSE